MKATTTPTTKVRLTRAAWRVVFATCAVGLFLAAWAPDALAHDHERTSKNKKVYTAFFATMESPCTFETVEIEGREHVQTQKQKNGHMTRFTITIFHSGKGVAMVTAKRYEYEDMAQTATYQSTKTTFYVRTTFEQHLIRKGERPLRRDDFFARSRMLIRYTNGEPDPTVVESFDGWKCK